MPGSANTVSMPTSKNKEMKMSEFWKICWPFLCPPLAIAALALIGWVFDIKSIRNSHKF